MQNGSIRVCGTTGGGTCRLTAARDAGASGSNGSAVRGLPGACRLLCEEAAQGTLEYALTIFAFISLIAALALLWRAGESGVLARLVEDACSHALDGTGLVDIALF